MTGYETLSVTAQIITFFFLTMSILYYYRQAKAAREQAIAATNQTNLLTASLERSTYLDFEASLFELSKLIIQNPQIRPYLYDKKPLPGKSDPDYNLVVSFCVFYLGFFDHALTMEKLSPNGTQWTEKKWKSWIEDMFNCSPALRQVFSEERHWYIDDLGPLLDRSKNNNHEIRISPNE